MNPIQFALLTLALVISTPVFAQSERQVQIQSIDFETEILEVVNLGNVAIDLDGWRFCSHDSNEAFRYTSPAALNGITLAPQESLFVHFRNDAPANVGNRVNLAALGPFATPLDRDAYGVQFYFPNANGTVSFSVSSLISDFVQWDLAGAPFDSTPRADQAVSEGLWTSVQDFVRTDADTARIELLDATGGLLHGGDDYAVITNVAPEAFFVRGDCNQDGSIGIADPLRLLGNLFAGLPPTTCADACDADDSGNLGLPDALATLNLLFNGGAPLPAPTVCGEDPTTDDLLCEAFNACP